MLFKKFILLFNFSLMKTLLNNGTFFTLFFENETLIFYHKNINKIINFC